MDDNTTQRPMTEPSDNSGGIHIGIDTSDPVPEQEAVPNPMWDVPQEYVAIDYSQFARVNTPDEALTAYFMGRRHGKSRVRVEETEQPKEVNLMPRKMSRVKEWSISARALKRVIAAACTGRVRYDYKFQAVYDERFRIYRIWNGVTRNVVATVKLGDRRGNSKTVIRYRPNSYYACAIASMADEKNLVVVPSTNLHVNRGRSEYGTNQTSKSKEAQLGFRRSAYELALRNRDKEQAKLHRKEILF